MLFSHVRALSKLLPQVNALAVSALLLFGCQAALNDGAKDQSPGLKLTLPEGACLKHAVPIIQSYFEARATPEEVGAVWDCIDQAVDAFASNTAGRNSDHYTPREIRSFLQEHFLGDLKLSDALLDEAMRVKQVLLGGRNDRLTRAELARARAVFKTLRGETLRLQPHIDILLLKAEPAVALQNPKRVEAAMSAVVISAAEMGSILSAASVTYETQHLRSLFSELKSIFKNWDGPDRISKYIPLFETAKSLLLNPDGGKIAPADWKPLLGNAAKAYSIFLRFHFLMSKQDLLAGAGLAQLASTIADLEGLIQDAIKIKPTKTIALSDLERAVTELRRLGLLNIDLKADSLSRVMDLAVKKFFNPRVNGKRAKADGLTLPMFARARDQIASWLHMQQAWEKTTALVVERNPNLAGRAIPVRILKNYWPKVAADLPSVAATTRAHEDILRLMKRESPIILAANGTVSYDRRSNYQAFSQTTFNGLNWRALAIRLLLNTYSQNRDPYAGLTKAETKELFDDLHFLLTDLKFVKSDDQTLWDTSFDESNIFMPSANADGLFSFFETFDFIAMTVGGAVMTQRLYDDMMANCTRDGKDHFGRPLAEADCSRDRYYRAFAKAHAELPHWTHIVRGLSPELYAELHYGFEMATRDGGITQGGFGLLDITKITMVMQYIEAIYYRFDEDSSGTITYLEAEKAFPLFSKILKDASGFTDDRKTFALFCYLLNYGHAPESLTAKLHFQLIWLSSESKWRKISADRMKLVGIVSSLAAATKKK